jgi:uncharacterized protein YbjT (DUF2867 family)
MAEGRRVFVTGGTGYMGGRLIPELLRRGHEVAALVRQGSERKLPSGCEAVPGDALDGGSYAPRVRGCDTFIHLVGVAHPGPAKAAQFQTIDRRSAVEAIRVAAGQGIRHFVYVSVAHPAPVMRAYVEARTACEADLRASGLRATILRPWYVLGPGHRWPYLLVPFYWLAERVPWTRETARRLGLVTLAQMVNAVAKAVDNPPEGVAVVEVPQIRASR